MMNNAQEVYDLIYELRERAIAGNGELRGDGIIETIDYLARLLDNDDYFAAPDDEPYHDTIDDYSTCCGQPLGSGHAEYCPLYGQ